LLLGGGIRARSGHKAWSIRIAADHRLAPPLSRDWISVRINTFDQCPRQDSNLRSRLRRPLLCTAVTWLYSFTKGAVGAQMGRGRRHGPAAGGAIWRWMTIRGIKGPDWPDASLARDGRGGLGTLRAAQQLGSERKASGRARPLAERSLHAERSATLARGGAVGDHRSPSTCMQASSSVVTTQASCARSRPDLPNSGRRLNAYVCTAWHLPSMS
jgi:hypothetical protein